VVGHDFAVCVGFCVSKHSNIVFILDRYELVILHCSKRKSVNCECWLIALINIYRGGMLDAYWGTSSCKDENGVLKVNVESRYKSFWYWSFNWRGYFFYYQWHHRCSRCTFWEGNCHPFVFTDGSKKISHI